MSAEISEQKDVAFGAPGMEPRWTSSSKEGVGTAYNTASRLWFTLSHGIVNELYYPCVDKPNTRDIQLLITDGESFMHEERCDLDHRTFYPEKGTLAYGIENKEKSGRYTIRKTVISDPYLPVLLIQHTLEIHDESLRGKLKIFLLVAPHLKGKGAGNSAHVIDLSGNPVLHASREDFHLACAASPSFGKASVGYVGQSDGYQDLVKHRDMTWTFKNAPDGNVAMTAELLPDDEGKFVVAIGLGGSLTGAITPMEQALAQSFDHIFANFVKQWKRLRHEDEDGMLAAHTGDNGSMYRLSRCILSAHEDKLFQGGLIASLSIPWGEVKDDEDLGGYHLVWPRDMLHTATAMLYSGQEELPLRTLIYLSCIQREDGSLPQNCWIDGTEYWPGDQLDETAAPVILARRLAVAGALQGYDPWVVALRAVAYLMIRGPSTGQERWEEASGYSPSTLAAVLAAVVSAAAFADERDETSIRDLLFSYSDWLRDGALKWTCTGKGTLDPAIPKHFVRIVHKAADKSGPAGDPADLTIHIANGGGEHRASDIVDAGFLNLVRFGFLDAKDKLVVDSLKLIDRELKDDFEGGPCWRRYQYDGYGTHTDGAAFDGSGYGGSWPLLTGERAHSELAAGRDVLPFIKAMESFANAGGMFPEQVWPLENTGRLRKGEPVGSAMPLCWAHAEYITLVQSAGAGYPLDRIPEAFTRYVENEPPKVGTYFWTPAHRTTEIPKGSRLMVLTDKPTKVRWKSGDGDWKETEARHSFESLHGADLGQVETDIELEFEGNFTVRVRQPLQASER